MAISDDRLSVPGSDTMSGTVVDFLSASNSTVNKSKSMRYKFDNGLVKTTTDNKTVSRLFDNLKNSSIASNVGVNELSVMAESAMPNLDKFTSIMGLPISNKNGLNGLFTDCPPGSGSNYDQWLAMLIASGLGDNADCYENPFISILNKVGAIADGVINEVISGSLGPVMGNVTNTLAANTDSINYLKDIAAISGKLGISNNTGFVSTLNSSIAAINTGPMAKTHIASDLIDDLYGKNISKTNISSVKGNKVISGAYSNKSKNRIPSIDTTTTRVGPLRKENVISGPSPDMDNYCSMNHFERVTSSAPSNVKDQCYMQEDLKKSTEQTNTGKWDNKLIYSKRYV